MLRKVIIVVFVLVGSYVSMTCGLVALSWYGQPGMPSEAMVGAKPNTEDTLRVVHLHQWLPDAPHGSTLEIFNVQLYDGTLEQRVLVMFTDASYQYLGPLKAQLGNTPLKTLLLQVGESRMIVGIVDDSVLAQVEQIGMYRSDTNAPGQSPTFKHNVLREGTFFIPIAPDEVDEWSSLRLIKLQSTKGWYSWVSPEYRLSLSDNEYEEQLSLNGLFVPVDQRLAHKETAQR